LCPSEHPWDQLLWRCDALGYHEIAENRSHILDPAAYGLNVADPKFANDMALEVVTPLSCFHEEHSGVGPQDRQRQAWKSCSRTQIRDRYKVRQMGHQRGRVQDQALSNSARIAVAREVESATPALDELCETYQGLDRTGRRYQRELSKTLAEQDRKGRIGQEEVPRGTPAELERSA
jgi:hypothetical protein